MSILFRILPTTNSSYMALLKTALNTLYPPQCMACHALVETEHAFCGACWRDVSFVHGLACDKCGVPLQGDDNDAALCDDCMAIERPWRHGTAAMVYSGTGKRMVLALKHGDRTELAAPAGKWIAAKVGPRDSRTVVIPVPLHRRRFIKRRYNQSALIAQSVAAGIGAEYIPDALIRHTHTDPLEGKTIDARFQTLTGIIAGNSSLDLTDKTVLLIDDVMTSGATLAACTDACLTAGADSVDIAVLARVAKTG